MWANISTFAVSALSLLSLGYSSPLEKRGTFSQVYDFGSNPTNVQMYTYVPSNLASNPKILVAIHYCTGMYSWKSAFFALLIDMP
jgi:poly(3-hydroxybutyrate) depolymerase